MFNDKKIIDHVDPNTNLFFDVDKNIITSGIENTDEFYNKILYINVDQWENPNVVNSKTKLGILLAFMSQDYQRFKNVYKGYQFIFCNDLNQSFILDVDKYKKTEFGTVQLLIKTLNNHPKINAVVGTESNKKEKLKQVHNPEEEQKTIDDKNKKELVDAVNRAAEEADSTEEALDVLDNDKYLANIIMDIEADSSTGPKLNVSRTNRMAKLNDEFLNTKVDKKTVRDIINDSDSIKELPVDTNIKVNSINDEWNDVRFTKFEEIYDLHEDILRCLYTLTSKKFPISIKDVNVEDVSNNMDYIYTYRVGLEDYEGKRSTLVFDMPKFKDKRFMRLRGNDKVMSGQLLLLPCTKSDSDTVQLVSFYNKIFVRRKGQVNKGYPASDRLIKALRKGSSKSLFKGIKIYFGDNRQICNKYELPVDYIDLATNINKIETSNFILYFNQDIYRTDYKIDPSNGIPIGVTKDGSILYYGKEHNDILLSTHIANLLCSNESFKEVYDETKVSNRLNYSEVSVLAAKIPLIVVMGLSLGFTNSLKKAGVKWRFRDKRESFDPDTQGIIKFKDQQIIYDLNYSSSMLMNGLAVCETDDVEFGDMDTKIPWLEFLENFGGKLLSDGLDNFEESFIDPITVEVCKNCNLPYEYYDLLIYANNLLADNKYIRHTDITGNRFRSNEQIAQIFYKCMCNAYESFKLQAKRGRKVNMTMKRSIVIDNILMNSTTSDLSILNPLLELEASNSISFKGPSGMNSDRAYGLDKRGYDESMINKVALSNSFAGNIGVSRWATIDMDIEGKRGYIKNTGKDDMSVTKALCVTEGITPFGVTHDDPFRTAMTFIQTSKHAMRTKKSMPLLITNGTDEAMPHMSSDTYCYKAKADGEVKEITDEYMTVEYKQMVDGFQGEYIDLRDNVKKCSDGGFYITIKLDTDYKVGNKFKKGDILAYDRISYSDKLGEDDNLAYNLGVLAKVAIMNTDEGFEDSTSTSYWLSEAMETEVVAKRDVSLSKDTNIYDIVKIGQKIQEGDPFIIFQNSFDEKDANALLKSITDEDYASDLGRQRIKSHYTGVIQDIKIYHTCEFDDLSDSLKKIVKQYEDRIRKTKKIYEKYNAGGSNVLDPIGKIPQTGIMKNIQDGVLIEFYMMYTDKFGVGDKLVAQSANKGTNKYIFPRGQEPFSEYRPEESIHALFAARSFNARKVTSVWVSGAINKVLIELDRQIKEELGIPQYRLEDIQ